MIFNILKLICIVNIFFSLNSFAMKRMNEKNIDDFKNEVVEFDSSNLHSTDAIDIPLDPQHQYVIGQGFLHERNYAEALKWLKAAADQNHAMAQYELGYYYFVKYTEIHGMPLRANQYLRLALKYFLMAAKSGYAQAQSILGSFYYNGNIIKKNYEQAFDWSLLAAKQNDLAAQYLLGKMYYKGKGIQQDYHESQKWFLLALNLEDPNNLYGKSIKKKMSTIYSKLKELENQYFEN